MDSSRFDSFTRALTDPRSRRTALSALFGAMLGLLGLAETTAKKGNGKRKKKKRKKPCVPACAGKTCGSDGCGGTCGSCNGACPDGTCICPSGSRLCGTTCQQCCLDVHCESGRTCQNGTCACPPDKPTFCPIQNFCGQCCDNTPCCGKLVCGLREPVCRADRTCGCADGRPKCANTNLCCLEGEICDEVVGGCTAPSDRNLKANFGSVDPVDMLERVRELPIATWNYTSDDPTVRHIGPMAQDFAALFGVGSDDRHIHPIDGQGVALAAIQGLLAELEQMRAENAQLAARITTLEGVKEARESVRRTQ